MKITDNTIALINGQQIKGERSEKMMTVLNSLVSSNVSEDQIYSIFYTKPIGEKFMEKGDTKDEWLLQQIEQAKTYVNRNNNKSNTQSYVPYAPGEFEIPSDNYLDNNFNPDQYNGYPPEPDMPPEPIKIVSGRDFIGKQFDSPSLIDNFLEEQGSLLLVGPSGVGKSLLTLYMALLIGNPNSRYLFGKFRVNRPLKSVFLQSENSEKIVHQRLKKMLQDPDLSPGLANIGFPYIKDQFTWTGKRIQSHLIHAIPNIKANYNADIIFIDPLISFAGVDENSNNEMRRVLDLLTMVCIANQMVPVIVHHRGKGDGDGAHSSRGASAITDWASNIMSLSNKRVNNEPAIMVKNSKARSFETFSDFIIQINKNLSFDLISTDKYKDTILKILKENGSFNNRKSFLQEIKKQLQISNRIALDIVNGLAKSNEIITEKGEKNAMKYSYNKRSK